jgi:hypothetical protein
MVAPRSDSVRRLTLGHRLQPGRAVVGLVELQAKAHALDMELLQAIEKLND